jgi:predicted XRE-type DNA-binding protein
MAERQKDTAAAENLKVRKRFMTAICRQVDAWGVTQVEAANRLGVTQPRLNDLLRGRVDKFSVDALIILATRAGLHVHLEAAPLSAGAPLLGAPPPTMNPKAPRAPRPDSVAKRKQRN